ncbi:hypothetical protein HNQ44_000426 [Planomicrobium koreense]|uniref:DUF7147 domain-containing protein n=1 Tax=Planococcus koreensis TaxID=112331 RepID=A0A7W8FQZ6_9BACL|nr:MULTISPECIES: methylthioribose kinase [Planococcus]MBB5179004.1 hypothetical protein [Planococcus koreensis]MDN3450173.1 methylthioribose kinase [Planococcus sp. APC 3906]
MIQRFIELGEGYGDIFELRELITTNSHRFKHGFIFVSEQHDGKSTLSVAAAFEPTAQGGFMPIYICREGIPENSKRLEIFEEAVKALGHTPIKMDVKHSSAYGEKRFYFSHLIAILRLNHYIPPMQ